MSKLTCVQAVYEHVKTMKDSTTFSRDYMHKRMSTYTPAAVNSALARIADGGGLKQKGEVFHINLPKLIKWGKNRTWKAFYNRKNSTKSKAPSDAEVLGNLVAAIAAAEPIIRKYQKIAEALND